MRAGLAGILSGCYLKKKPTDYGILDGPGMVNYDGLLLDARWATGATGMNVTA